MKLPDVVEAMESSNDEALNLLDVKTGEFAFIFDGLVNEDEDPDLAEEIQCSDDYISLPDRFDIDKYRMMKHFICGVDDDQLRERLLRAVHGRGAFRRFKDTLGDVGRLREWFDYRDAGHGQIAREWCEDHGLEIEE